ncbi:unnamed protein product [marine sediment metagenome]|uniref:Uncharacterized protein n=1 Tax=marine sediment metagenome TaxID=412755 RepID=X0U0D8_9ZZZZ
MKGAKMNEDEIKKELLEMIEGHRGMKEINGATVIKLEDDFFNILNKTFLRTFDFRGETFEAVEYLMELGE